MASCFFPPSNQITIEIEMMRNYFMCFFFLIIILFFVSLSSFYWLAESKEMKSEWERVEPVERERCYIRAPPAVHARGFGGICSIQIHTHTLSLLLLHLLLLWVGINTTFTFLESWGTSILSWAIALGWAIFIKAIRRRQAGRQAGLEHCCVDTLFCFCFFVFLFDWSVFQVLS